jgi:DNA (cytosine-5)-methyltransferase 1
MQAHRITDSEFSSLPTPTVSDQYTGNLKSSQQKEGSLHSVTLAQIVHRPDLLPTPAVGHIRNNDEPIEDYLGRRAKAESGEYKGMPGVSLGVAVRMQLFPTPIVRDYKDGQAPAVRDGVVQTDTVGRAVMNSGEISESSWGKFEAAIRRWEETFGREAPAPTKPDGKECAHRLSADFVEWMMGLPEGWVCSPELGLKRNDQLKALGNGVVPQQAELALRLLITEDIKAILET